MSYLKSFVHPLLKESTSWSPVNFVKFHLLNQHLTSGKEQLSSTVFLQLNIGETKIKMYQFT